MKVSAASGLCLHGHLWRRRGVSRVVDWTRGPDAGQVRRGQGQGRCTRRGTGGGEGMGAHLDRPGDGTWVSVHVVSDFREDGPKRYREGQNLGPGLGWRCSQVRRQLG